MTRVLMIAGLVAGLIVSGARWAKARIVWAPRRGLSRRAIHWRRRGRLGFQPRSIRKG